MTDASVANPDANAMSVDLWPIGNCQVSALIDRAGRFVWACVPRVDGDPLFVADPQAGPYVPLTRQALDRLGIAPFRPES